MTATKATKVNVRSVDEIKPIGNRVLVKRDDAESKSEGGILIPENAKDKQKTGKVIAVGDGRTLEDGVRISIPLMKGQRVVFNAYAGAEIKHQGETYLILGMDDVLAVLR